MSQPTLSIVTAGAGSGKTWRITQDIKREVLENGVPPAGLLATTFTRKAAAELQLRVQTALIAARQGETALAMQEALLGTVNSVCGRLLAEFAFEAGISPDLTVLDETGEAEAFAIAFGDAAGTAEDRIAPVAFRLGLAGEANGGDWHEPVRKIVSGARANRLDAAALRMSETRSLAGVLEMLSTPDPAGAAALDAAGPGHDPPACSGGQMGSRRREKEHARRPRDGARHAPAFCTAGSPLSHLGRLGGSGYARSRCGAQSGFRGSHRGRGGA
jgi:hypothetical protein